MFNITGELKLATRHRSKDIISMSMDNPAGSTSVRIVDKLVEAA